MVSTFRDPAGNLVVVWQTGRRDEGARVNSVRRGDEPTVVEATEPYAARSVSALGTWQCGDWRVKKYAIAYRREGARAELMEAAEAAAARVLPTPAVTPRRYGVGFLGVDDGRGGNLVFVDWWEEENEPTQARSVPRHQPTRSRASGISASSRTSARPGSIAPSCPTCPTWTPIWGTN